MEKTLTVVDEPQTKLEQKLKAPSPPERLVQFLHDVRSEMRKVITPTPAEVRSNTAIVVATVFIFAGYFWVVDAVVGQVIERVLGAFSKH